MESALLLRSNTLLPRSPRPLSILTSNFRFGFRHCCFSPGTKYSISYPVRQRQRQRQMPSPITTCALGGFRKRPRQKEGNEQKMMAAAKRVVERAAVTLACVIIGIIGYGFWLKQVVVAAPDDDDQVGICFPQIESIIIPREGMSKKPCPPIKAHTHYCKYRRVAPQTGSESSRNENLQKPNSEVSGDKQEKLQKPNSEVAGDDKQENLQKPNSEVTGDDKQENLNQNPNSEVPGDKQENLQNPNSELPGDTNDNLEKPNSEVLGDRNDNLEKPNSEFAAAVPRVLDKLEDLSQSKIVPQQQTPSPPHHHGGELGSLLTGTLLGGLISETGKHLIPELRAITSDVKVDDSSQSPLLPPPESSKRSLLSPDTAEKDLTKSELKGKTIDPKAEDFPQSLSQEVPLTGSKKSLVSADMAEKQGQQDPFTASKKSILSEDMAEKHLRLKPEGRQEELQLKTSDVVKGDPTTRTTAAQIDSGAGTVSITATEKNSLPSPLVSITFKVDYPAMPNLAFVSPSAVTPAEPRRPDRVEGAKVVLRGVPVSSSASPMEEQIFAEHGDVTASCILKDQAFRANLVEGLAGVKQILQECPSRKLTNDDLILIHKKLEDLEKVNVNVGWLRERIDEVGPFLDVVESRKKWEAVAAEVVKLGAKLAEQEAKLAEHEEALAKKFAEKAEVNEREMVVVEKFAEKAEVNEAQDLTNEDELRKEDEAAHAWTFNDLGILLHAFGFGSLFYLFFMPK